MTWALGGWGRITEFGCTRVTLEQGDETRMLRLSGVKVFLVLLG